MELYNIPNYDGYSINKAGEVFSSKVVKARKMKPTINSNGYVRYSFRVDGGYKREYLHRLMLITFDRPPKEGEVCRHLDGNPLNNDISNLKWGTQHENIRDAGEHGVMNIKLTWEDVDEIRYLYSNGHTQSQIHKKTGWSHRIITNVVSGLSWSEKHRREPFTRAYEYEMRKEWLEGKTRDKTTIERDNVRLTQEKADEIRILRSQGMMIKDIAAKYGVSLGCIGGVVQNVNWVREDER